MMSKFKDDLGYVEDRIRKYLEGQDINNFVNPSKFCVSLRKGIDREVLAYYKGKGWKIVKGGPEDDCDYLRFK